MMFADDPLENLEHWTAQLRDWADEGLSIASSYRDDNDSAGPIAGTRRSQHLRSSPSWADGYETIGVQIEPLDDNGNHLDTSAAGWHILWPDVRDSLVAAHYRSIDEHMVLHFGPVIPCVTCDDGHRLASRAEQSACNGSADWPAITMLPGGGLFWSFANDPSIYVDDDYYDRLPSVAGARAILAGCDVCTDDEACDFLHHDVLHAIAAGLGYLVKRASRRPGTWQPLNGGDISIGIERSSVLEATNSFTMFTESFLPTRDWYYNAGPGAVEPFEIHTPELPHIDVALPCDLPPFLA